MKNTDSTDRANKNANPSFISLLFLAALSFIILKAFLPALFAVLLAPAAMLVLMYVADLIWNTVKGTKQS